MDKIQKLFNKAKEYGDDKVQLAIQTYELVSMQHPGVASKVIDLICCLNRLTNISADLTLTWHALKQKSKTKQL